jgi:hypothetical protein
MYRVINSDAYVFTILSSSSFENYRRRSSWTAFTIITTRLIHLFSGMLIRVFLNLERFYEYFCYNSILPLFFGINFGVAFAKRPGVATALERPVNSLFCSSSRFLLSCFAASSSRRFLSSISFSNAAAFNRSICLRFRALSKDSLIEKHIGHNSASHSPSTAVTHDMYSFVVLINSW